MGEYGVHPTRYGEVSDGHLYSMFRESAYARLSESEKLDLLQEVVNRDAMEKGEIGAPEVRFAELPVNESGNAADGVIQVNRDMAVSGVQTFEYKGQTVQHRMDDYNCQTLNTILHENMHCFQDQVIDGTIQIDDLQLTSEYQANSYTNSIVFQNGKGQWGSQYMTGETANGYYMYYFQATERDAYRTTEEKTASILQELSGKYGTEASFETYTKSMATTGYQAMEQKAILEFQNPNFEKDLNQVLQNQYFGTNVEVDKNTEEAVKAEMIATYQNLYEQLGESTAANEDVKMSFDPRPVSLEEYNQAVQNPAAADEEVYEEAEETAEKGPEADTQSQQENEEASVSDEDITDGIDSDMEI